MCANYRPSSRDWIHEQFQVDCSAEYAGEAWPGSFAPILLRNDDDGLVARVARFGLIPHFARDTKFARHTYNARSETVAEKPSFRTAWKNRRYCLIPASRIYEPCYESGKAVRWSIQRADGQDFAIAGIWSAWKNPATGDTELGFSMLTLNADDHPLMSRFHKPGDEKRMVYVVTQNDYSHWLSATTEQARTMIEAFPAESMVAEVHPMTRRAPSEDSISTRQK